MAPKKATRPQNQGYKPKGPNLNPFEYVGGPGPKSEDEVKARQGFITGAPRALNSGRGFTSLRVQVHEQGVLGPNNSHSSLYRTQSPCCFGTWTLRAWRLMGGIWGRRIPALPNASKVHQRKGAVAWQHVYIIWMVVKSFYPINNKEPKRDHSFDNHPYKQR